MKVSLTVSENFKTGRANYSSEGCTVSISPELDGDFGIVKLRAVEAVLKYEAHLAVLQAQVLSGDLLAEQVPALMKAHTDFRNAALKKAGVLEYDTESIDRFLGC